MKTRSFRLLFLLLFLLTTYTGEAQSIGELGNRSIPYIIVIVIVVFLLLMGWPLYMMYKPKGRKSQGLRYSSPKGFIPPSMPTYVSGKKVKVLKQGYDIVLTGQAEEHLLDRSVQTYALQPKNYRGMSPIPKVEVSVGDNVKAGDVIFFDKKIPEVKYVSPVSGQVKEIKRGEKRSIAEIIISASKDTQYKKLNAPDLNKATREQLVDFLCASGGWTLINQRPFDVIPDIEDEPRDIFISSFDTSPLAPNLNIAVKGNGEAFQLGINLLGKLTKGNVHLGLNANSKDAPADEFSTAKNVQIHWFHGQHPAGNVGIQIHHISPIKNAADKVWTLGVQDVITLGKLFTENKWVADRVIAVSGSQLLKTGYIRTKIGANIGELVGTDDDTLRYISGNVLSGESKSLGSFVNWDNNQVSVIEEGRYFEPFGWLLPTKIGPSFSRSYASYFTSKKQYDADSNTHGEKRAFVMTGEYERVLPMNIYVQHLMKAILVNDYEQMEGLGLLELNEEDVSLCEFICTSKMPLQKILRQGLDMMQEQS